MERGRGIQISRVVRQLSHTQSILILESKGPKTALLANTSFKTPN